jgi:Flp pilus assembly protein TadD
MKQLTLVLLLAALSAGVALGDTPEEFDLKFDRLEPVLEVLSAADRDAVSDAINLLKRGENVLALSRLSALKQRNPNNSSLRILASYALLQAGNLLGAFEEAEKAHVAPNGNSYKCWFLAKIALINGKTAICERELEHVKGAGDMVAEARELEKELKSN